MATNKSNKKHSKKHSNKKHSNKKHSNITKKKHRSHRHRSRSRSNTWQNNYVYESDNVNLSSVSNTTNKNNGNIINGLRDYLSLKKDMKK